MKHKVKILIIGAGVGGLAAASYVKFFKEDFMVVELNNELPKNLHNGVHYLHSTPALPCSIEFKEITLTDGILVDGKIEHQANLMHALEYSQKVREIQHPSSIMDVGKNNKVYMTKDNSINSMLQTMYDYADHDNFHFGYSLDAIDVNAKCARFVKDGIREFVEYETIITTLPLNRLVKMLPPDEDLVIPTECAPVHITNYGVSGIVPNWMINLYVPSEFIPVYRVSLLNGICSVESTRPLTPTEIANNYHLLSMFGLTREKPTTYTWDTGKVLSISRDERERVVKALMRMGIYSIGRFGLWNRKLLMDTTIKQAQDVVVHILDLESINIVDKLSK